MIINNINYAGRQMTINELMQSWPEDREQRAEPKKLTALFHSSVPILKHLEWKVTDTGRGFAETILPLNIASTNQHITHQAAVFLIAADYTVGIALGTLLDNVPLVGIHPQNTDYGAYLWGARADIKWICPSCDDLICKARIPQAQFETIIQRFFRGDRVMETVPIDMWNKDKLVAMANITYFVQDTYSLRKNAFDKDKVHVLFDHRQKTSARMIAGLRAMEQDRPEDTRLFNDPYANAVADTHGRILAQRICLVAPQTQLMVSSRTRHLDEAIESFHQGKPCQVVNIGAGLDTRFVRLELPRGSRLYELDLPLMLEACATQIATLAANSNILRIQVPIDLRAHDISEQLRRSDGFNPAMQTFIVWEGGSMYFDKDDTARILRSIAKILIHPSSRFWMDYVHQSVVDGNSGIDVVDRFTDAMRCMGEPFINGFTDIREQLLVSGLVVERDEASDIFLKTVDPVFRLYRFCLVRAGN